jgi:adenylate kinase
MDNVPTVVIFGPPYSGKGTVGSRLAATESRFHYASSGDIIREAIKSGSDLGSELRGYTDNGILVPDDLVLRLFRAKMAEQLASGEFNPRENVLLVDGMCRTPAQARSLDGECSFLDVYNFTVPDEELTKRALARKRSDDTPEAIARRLAQFKTDTLPTLEYFEERGVPVFAVDGNRPRDEVFNSVLGRVLERAVNYWP